MEMLINFGKVAIFMVEWWQMARNNVRQMYRCKKCGIAKLRFPHEKCDCNLWGENPGTN